MRMYRTFFLVGSVALSAESLASNKEDAVTSEEVPTVEAFQRQVTEQVGDFFGPLAQRLRERHGQREKDSLAAVNRWFDLAERSPKELRALFKAIKTTVPDAVHQRPGAFALMSWGIPLTHPDPEKELPVPQLENRYQGTVKAFQLSNGSEELNPFGGHTRMDYEREVFEDGSTAIYWGEPHPGGGLGLRNLKEDWRAEDRKNALEAVKENVPKMWAYHPDVVTAESRFWQEVAELERIAYQYLLFGHVRERPIRDALEKIVDARMRAIGRHEVVKTAEASSEASVVSLAHRRLSERAPKGHRGRSTAMDAIGAGKLGLHTFREPVRAKAVHRQVGQAAHAD